MRLLDVRAFELRGFVDRHSPYAILSHCWEDEEVIYADLFDLASAKRKDGFAKVKNTC